MPTLTFRCVQNDETKFWHFDPSCHPTPPPGTKIFGIYMFCEGEATYCCSLTPSSFMMCVSFETDAPDGPFRDYFYDELNIHLHESDHYAEFIRDVSQHKNVSVSSFDVEIDDDEDDYQRAKAWEEAREYFQGNAPQFNN